MFKYCAGVRLAVVAGVLFLGSAAAEAQPSSPSDIEWQEGPGTGQIGDIAEIRIDRSSCHCIVPCNDP